MLKKFMKAVLSLATVLAVIFSVSSLASAANTPDIHVRLGGNDVTITTAASDSGRIYAPYDALFKAMGATASYDSKSGTITAVSGPTSVSFVLGGDEMTVTAGQVSQKISIDAGPYTDNGSVLVPVRYAAQAFGYMVTWDAASQTVLLQSIDDLIAQSGATYTLIDRYLASQKDFSAKNHAVSGDFTLNLSMPSADGKASVPMTATGTLSGLVNQSDSEMGLQMKSNASEFAAAMGAGTMDDQTKLMLSLLDNLEMNLIMNTQTGMIYIKSPFLSTVMSQKADTWLSMNLNSLTSGLPLGALSGQLANTSSLKNYISVTMKTLCLYDTGTGTAQVQEMLALLNGMLSDQAFVKTGDNYVSTYSPDMGGEAMAMTGTLKTTLKFSGTTYTGMALDASLNLGGMGTMTMNCALDATGGGSVKMNMSMPTFMTMDMTANFAYTDTTKAPASQPPAGSTIVPIDGILSSLMPDLTM